MKVIALCDDHGEIRSLVFPNPELEGTIGVESDQARVVHYLEVDEDLLRREEMSRSEEARKEAYALIGRLLPR
jgi:hypothetical protein